MPITYSGLYDRMATFPNLYRCYLDCIKGRKNKPDVLQFYGHHEAEIRRLQEELLARTWTPSGYQEFVSRTEVKRRVIHAPVFEDRIVHMAVYKALVPLFEPKFIYDSYACRWGKGGHRAMRRTQQFLQRAQRQYERVYVLQGDIAKFYPSVYKPCLMEKYARTVRDRDMLALLETIYYDYNGSERGIPIGATTSQLAANVLLDTLDQFAKNILRVRYYLRYMDDFILIAGSKAELWYYLKEIEWLLSGTLRLSLNPKTRVYPASQGVDFVGYRIWASHVLPRKRDIKAAKLRFKRLSHDYRLGKITIEDVRPRVASFLGYAKHCNAYRTTISTLKWLHLQRRK